MTRPYSEASFIINGPAWGDAGAIAQFLLGVADVSSIVNLLAQEPEFSQRMEGLDPFGFNLGIDALLIVKEYCNNFGPVVIPTSSHLAEGFTILEGCGLFRRVDQHYDIAIPPDLSQETVKTAVYRLLDTQEHAVTLHPENLVLSVHPDAIRTELAALERSRNRSFFAA